MKFCHNCGNKISPFEEENVLKYKCNDCNTIVENDSSIISESHYKYDFIIDTHLSIKSNRRYDNAIKRSKKHNCPNESCNNSWNKEVIIICEKDTLQNIYMCCSCLTEWKYS